MFIVWFVLAWWGISSLPMGVADHLCSKCRYFLYNTNTEISKCSAFPTVSHKVNPTDTYTTHHKRLMELLITGYHNPTEIITVDYVYCSIARNDEQLCGMSGKRYEPRF